MINCIIIEDEKASQEALKNRIKTHFPELQIQAIIDNAPEAIAYLSQHKIDLVFMDNHIKQGRGMDVLNHFKNRDFTVIFSTAFSNYAIEALNNDVSYYLLKPYSDNEFILAVNKYLNTKFENIKSITIGSNKEIILFKSIYFLESEGAYTIFHLEGGKTIYTSKNLGYYEKRLPQKDFFRIHHSSIINLKKIDQVLKNKINTVKLTNGVELPISSRKFKNFLIQINP